MKLHSFHPEAAQEYAFAVELYHRINSALGVRFYEKMERLIEDIRQQPEWFRQFDPPARRHFSSDFPYAIIYLDQSDRIWIVAVMHMKREPGYWRKRLD